MQWKPQKLFGIINFPESHQKTEMVKFFDFHESPRPPKQFSNNENNTEISHVSTEHIKHTCLGFSYCN